MHRSHYIDSRSAGNKQFQSLRYTHLGTIQSIKNHVNKKVNLDGTSYASIKHLHRAVTLKDHKKKSSAQLLKKKGEGAVTHDRTKIMPNLMRNNLPLRPRISGHSSSRNDSRTPTASVLLTQSTQPRHADLGTSRAPAHEVPQTRTVISQRPAPRGEE